MAKSDEVLRQYSFLLPKSVGLQIEAIARARGKNMEELVRQSLKIGLLILQAEEKKSDGRLLWEENGETVELEIFGVRKKVVAAKVEDAVE